MVTAHKASVHIDEQSHRELKAAARRLGLPRPDFMAQAARRPRRQPGHGAAGRIVAELRQEVLASAAPEERRAWP